MSSIGEALRTAGPGNLTGLEAAEAVATGTTTVEAITDDAWRRMDAWEPELGAIVRRIDPPRTGDTGPLNGITVGVKDLIAVKGYPRGCGAPEFDFPPATEDATVVSRLVEAGASIVALTSLPQFFASSGGVTPQTRNPRDRRVISGGSSGGSAAALAAGLIHVALGTEAGGSVRIPASCCGVVGLKTTAGLVPLTGEANIVWSIGTIGPMAANVDDVAAALWAMAGFDARDPYSREPPYRPGDGRDRPSAQAGSVAGRRIGIPRQVRESAIDRDVRQVWEKAMDLLVGDGAVMEEVDIPEFEQAQSATGTLVYAESAAALTPLRETYPASFFREATRDRIEKGTGLTAIEVSEAYKMREIVAYRMRQIFDDVDLLLTPTMPCRVPEIGKETIEVDGRTEPRGGAITRFTSIWNLAGLPAGTVPAGVDTRGNPVGVQVVGPSFSEPQVLDLMAAIERATGGPMDTVALS